MGQFAVVLPAAGNSSRFGDKEKKPFVTLDGRPIWLRTAELFVNRDDVCQCIVVIAPNDEEKFRSRYGPNLAFMDIEVVLGGAERFESVANALKILKTEVEHVAIHDAVRPCVTSEQISTVFQKAEATGAAILAVPVTDTVKEVNYQSEITSTKSREGLWLAQTPQVFRRDWLESGYAKRIELGRTITDDAQLVEAVGHAVSVVEGSRSNIKITTQPDLKLAEAILKSLPKAKSDRPASPFDEEAMW
ncbi:MAG: 2-C-methyl-D-erythritol 4-phosphate cytidylyltransferase [Gemmataceae bacterium]